LSVEEKIGKEVEKEKTTQDILDYENEIRRKKEEEWRVNKYIRLFKLNNIIA